MKRHLQCAEQQVSLSNLTKYCACHEKWVLCLILVTYETSFPMRGATGVHYPTSPNTAPATKNDTARFQRKISKNRWNVISNAGTIRAWSEHDPTMIRPWNRQSATRLASEVTFRAHHKPFSIEKYNVSRPNLTFKHSPSAAPATKSNTWPSPILPLPRKVTLELHQYCPYHEKETLELHQVLHLHKSDTWPSPSTAPATKVTVELHLLYYSTWLYSTYSTWLYSTWLYSTWFYSTWPTLLDSTLLDTILLDSTLLDSTLRDPTLLDTTLLYLTLFYLTLLYLTLLDVVYIGSSHLNFLWQTNNVWMWKSFLFWAMHEPFHQVLLLWHRLLEYVIDPIVIEVCFKWMPSCHRGYSDSEMAALFASEKNPGLDFMFCTKDDEKYSKASFSLGMVCLG